MWPISIGPSASLLVAGHDRLRRAVRWCTAHVMCEPHRPLNKGADNAFIPVTTSASMPSLLACGAAIPCLQANESASGQQHRHSPLHGLRRPLWTQG